MLKSLGDVLKHDAQDLFARTKLPRASDAYLTQRQAFDIHRKRKLEDLMKNAPDLYARMDLPPTDSDYLESHRAHHLYRNRKKSNK